MDFDGGSGGGRDFLQKPAFLADRLDEMDLQTGTICEHDGEDHSGEAGPASEVDEGPGVGRDVLEQLGGVEDVPVPHVWQS
jgi:hypothetical protein